MARHSPADYVKERILAAGGAIDGVDINKHVKIYWTLNGHKNMTVCAISPGDTRGLNNLIAVVKRQIRQSALYNPPKRA